MREEENIQAIYMLSSIIWYINLEKDLNIEN